LSILGKKNSTQIIGFTDDFQLIKDKLWIFIMESARSDRKYQEMELSAYTSLIKPVMKLLAPSPTQIKFDNFYSK